MGNPSPAGRPGHCLPFRCTLRGMSQTLSEIAYEVYRKDLDSRVTCDCDFHEGRWSFTSVSYWSPSGRLKYAKDGDPLTSEFCNHPNRLRVSHIGPQVSPSVPLSTECPCGITRARCEYHG